ncbi:hypothetical protein PNQ69_15625 [Xanthomonas sp. A2111]|uniref:Uncharacterized protein n=1 Tax=Xanthomonas hawaiiensis TaxID=3003247 RepID=A0ABU2I7S6_9XANT|nr:hypothetical protein [Xanthomonas sp. A2111]MDS9994194.1 hypothetical protein [Xanthomonas sp. A2111]
MPTPPARDPARLVMRTHARALLRDPRDAAAHLARLHAALQLHDNEPTQGVLADLFVALPRHDIALRKLALQMAATHLPPHVAEAFQRHSQGHALLPINALATRWSVLARPSADVPARVRRASPDHSRRMVREVVDALCDGAPIAAARCEREFLDYCISCQDKLAFMLATRELRRHALALGDRWDSTARWLQQREPLGGRSVDALSFSSASAPR